MSGAVIIAAIGVFISLIVGFVVFTRNWKDRPVKDQLCRWYWAGKAKYETQRGIRKSSFPKLSFYVWDPDSGNTFLFFLAHKQVKMSFAEKDGVLQGEPIYPGMMGKFIVHDGETGEQVWGGEDRYCYLFEEISTKIPGRNKLHFIELESPRPYNRSHDA